MLIKTQGIVFKTIKYGETSVISDIYTKEKGLRSYILRGVRSKRAKVKASLLQVMSIVDMVAYERSDKKLHSVKEIKSAFVYQNLPFDVRRSAVGLFIAEVARKSIREPEENKPLFDFLLSTFQFLDATPHSIANIHLWFMLRLTTFLGFVPGGDWGENTPVFDLKEGVFVKEEPDHLHFLQAAESQLFYKLLITGLSDSHQISMPRATRKQLLSRIIDYYRLHIENFPEINAHTILEEVLE
jgi:DNA repair protein RecO (recombination protein O)